MVEEYSEKVKEIVQKLTEYNVYGNSNLGIQPKTEQQIVVNQLKKELTALIPSKKEEKIQFFNLIPHKSYLNLDVNFFEKLTIKNKKELEAFLFFREGSDESQIHINGFKYNNKVFLSLGNSLELMEPKDIVDVKQFLITAKIKLTSKLNNWIIKDMSFNEIVDFCLQEIFVYDKSGVLTKKMRFMEMNLMSFYQQLNIIDLLNALILELIQKKSNQELKEIIKQNLKIFNCLIDTPFRFLMNESEEDRVETIISTVIKRIEDTSDIIW